MTKIAEELFYTDIEDIPLRNGKRMASAITIICCMHKKHLKIDSNYKSALLSMLRLLPDIQSQKCIDWEYVSELMPTAFRTLACESIRAMILSLSNTRYFSQPEWLFAIPVVHFLYGASVPFQDRILSPCDIPWRDKYIDLGNVRRNTYDTVAE